jgi:outer membrane biosynthesis protein TonB
VRAVVRLVLIGCLAIVGLAVVAEESQPQEKPASAESKTEDPCGEGEIAGGILGGEPGKGAPPIPVKGDVVAPKLISRVKPSYPKDANDAKLEAKIFFQGVIEKNGTVGCLETLMVKVMKKGESQGDPALGSYKPQFEAAAKAAVKQWRYEPARSKGEPVRVYFTAVVDFQLEK